MADSRSSRFKLLMAQSSIELEPLVLRKMVLLVEVLMEIAPEMFVVEVKVMDNSGCGGMLLEFEDVNWEGVANRSWGYCFFLA
ncbi:hypothetical protein WN943_001242 [Citrus x changshan-huyou]